MTGDLRDLAAHAVDGLVEIRAGEHAGTVRVSIRAARDAKRYSVEGLLGECVRRLLSIAQPWHASTGVLTTEEPDG